MRKQLRDAIGRDLAVQVGDDTITGALVLVNAEGLTLGDAALATAAPVPMDGETVIPWHAVRWVQVV